MEAVITCSCVLDILITVLVSIFCLFYFYQVTFTNMPSQMLCGEVQQVGVQFENIGDLPLKHLKVASTHPDFFTFSDDANKIDNSNTYQTLTNTSDTDSEEFPVKTKPIKYVIDIPINGGSLNPGDSITRPMWIRGPEKAGQHVVKYLFYYESADKSPKLK